MTEVMATPQRWTDDQRDQMVSLLAHVDTVELKLSVPDADRQSTVAALDLDPLAADMVQVWFFDTPDLDLHHGGVVVRARRSRTREDAVVKLRPVTPDDLAPELRALRGFGVEIDASPEAFVCSARLKAKLEPGTVRRSVLGGKPPRKLFGKRQRMFFQQFAPTGRGLDELSPLGPITVLKLAFVPAGFDRKMVAELWMYPDGSRLLELSTKCEPSAAFAVAARTRSYLEGLGIDLSGEQQTKTKSALEYFSSELRLGQGRVAQT